MKLSITEHLLYAVEQRIGKIYSYKVMHELESPSIKDPYLFYLKQPDGRYIRYSVECFRDVPVKYVSENISIDFEPTDTIHTSFFKIIEAEMQQASYTGVLKGVLTFETGNLKSLNYEMDLNN